MGKPILTDEQEKKFNETVKKFEVHSDRFFVVLKLLDKAFSEVQKACEIAYEELKRPLNADDHKEIDAIERGEKSYD